MEGTHFVVLPSIGCGGGGHRRCVHFAELLNTNSFRAGCQSSSSGGLIELLFYNDPVGGHSIVGPNTSSLRRAPACPVHELLEQVQNMVQRPLPYRPIPLQTASDPLLPKGVQPPLSAQADQLDPRAQDEDVLKKLERELCMAGIIVFAVQELRRCG